MFTSYFKEIGGANSLYSPYGFLVYNLHPENKECFLQHLYVKPEHRRCGIATALFNSVQDIAYSKGAKKIGCIIEKNHKNSEHVFALSKAQGFKIIEETPYTYIMHKEL